MLILVYMSPLQEKYILPKSWRKRIPTKHPTMSKQATSAPRETFISYPIGPPRVGSGTAYIPILTDMLAYVRSDTRTVLDGRVLDGKVLDTWGHSDWVPKSSA